MDLHADRTRAILDELFLHPPVSLAELDQRLGPVSVHAARRLLAERLAAPACELSEGDGELLVHLFQHLGVGREGDALLDIVADRERAVRVRARALAILVHDKTDYSDAVRRRISDDEVLALAAEPLCNLLAAIEVDPSEAEELAEALEAAAPALRAGLFERLEAHRRQVGTPAAVAYAQVLRRPALDELREPLLAALVDEGGRDAEALLEALRDEPAAQRDARLRRNIQGALLRLRTRAIEGRSKNPGACRAYFSSCDGQGAYFLLGCRDNPDGTATLAMLCIRAAGDIRDGYVVPRQTPAQVEQILLRISRDAHAGFADLSLAQAVPIVAAAVQRTEALKLPLPSESIAALRFFERAEPLEGHAPASLPTVKISPAALPRVTLAAVRTLLSRPEYRYSWFFDETDLSHAQVPVPDSPRPKVAWFQQASRLLAARPLLVQRVVGLAEHMAAWHTLRGETAPAALCTAMAGGTRSDFARSPLVRVLLERFLAPLDLEAEAGGSEAAAQPRDWTDSDALRITSFDTEARLGAEAAAAGDGEPAGVGDDDDDDDVDQDEPELGDPARRRQLKALFFSDVSQPRGRDLALLDLTEAALTALDRGLMSLPGEVQPREDRRLAAAYELSRLFRDFLLSNQPHAAAVARLHEAFARTLGETCSLGASECERLALGMLKVLTGFVDSVCGKCPVNCLNAPRASVAAEFFSTEHPASARLAEVPLGGRGPRRSAPEAPAPEAGSGPGSGPGPGFQTTRATAPDEESDPETGSLDAAARSHNHDHDPLR